MRFTEYIGSQFGNPRGIVGQICCITMNIINDRLYQAVCDALPENPDNTILDIGFGNGYLEKKLSRRTDLTIKGIDISEDMLVSAAKRNRKSIAQGNVELSLGDCCDLKFQNDSFDAVASVNTIYFWPDTVKGLTEIRRVLKKGGVFVNTVYSQEWLQRLSYTRKGFRFFSKDDYIRDGGRAGFSEVALAEIAKGKSYLVTYVK